MRSGCKHARIVYRDRLNVALLKREGAFRAECRACGVPRPIGIATDHGVPPVELWLGAAVAETLHAETDPKMVPYHWEALIDCALLKHYGELPRTRSAIERMIDVACGVGAPLPG